MGQDHHRLEIAGISPFRQAQHVGHAGVGTLTTSRSRSTSRANKANSLKRPMSEATLVLASFRRCVCRRNVEAVIPSAMTNTPDKK